MGPDTRADSGSSSVALDRREIAEAESGFRTVLVRSLAVLGLALLIALWAQVQVGLRPLTALRGALNRVHSGAAVVSRAGFRPRSSRWSRT